MMEFTGERFVPQLDGEIKYEHLHRYALALDLIEGRSVLDIASGEGYGSALLAERAESVIGVDIDPESISHAQQQYQHLPNLKFLVGSCSAIPVADASIDVVVSFETIEHHDQHKEMMQEIQRVLKPDGYLILSSPNRPVYSGEAQRSNSFHIKELDYEELVDLLKSYFQRIDIYGQQLAAGSWIIPLKPSDQPNIKAFSGNFHTLSRSISAFPKPFYFVAICTNADRAASLESVYIDPSDDLLRQLYDDRHLKQLEIFRLQEGCNQLHHANEQLQSVLAQTQEKVQELDHLQQNYNNQLQEAETLVKAMESSKFWKLRRIWMDFRQFLLKR